VIDAGHGGQERGAGLSEELPEKDVCLSFARHLLKELQNRGIPHSFCATPTSHFFWGNERAGEFGASAIYIALHAASQGRGVRVYTPLMPYSGNANGPFQPWETAQAPYVRTAAVAAASVAAELRKHKNSPREFSPRLCVR